VAEVTEKWKTESEDFLKRLTEVKNEILNSKPGTETHKKGKEKGSSETKRQRLKLPGLLLRMKEGVNDLVRLFKRALLVLGKDSLSVDDLNELISRIMYLMVIYEKSYHEEGLNLKGKFFALPLLHQIRKRLGLMLLKERFKRANFFFLAVVSVLVEFFLGILPSDSGSIVSFLTFVFLIIFIVSIYFSISAYEKERDFVDALLLIEVRLRNK